MTLKDFEKPEYAVLYQAPARLLVEKLDHFPQEAPAASGWAWLWLLLPAFAAGYLVGHLAWALWSGRLP